MANQSSSPRKNIFNSNIGTKQSPNSVTEGQVHEGKRIIAAKIAGAVGTGGAPIRVINAFLQVKDYVGLDRYLGKHKIPSDILTSALQKSCMTSDSESVELLAKHGANVNYVDQFGTTLLHFAMRGGGNELVILALVSHGLDYSSWRSEGMPLLHWACSRGQMKLVEYIVDKENGSLQQPDDSGRLPIHVAAVSGQPDVLSYLIQALSQHLCMSNIPTQFREALDELQLDDECENKSTQGECNPMMRPPKLIIGTAYNRTKKEKMHTEFRGTPQTIAAANYLDQQQWTPLHHASCEEAIHYYQDCLRVLLDHGADPMLPTPQGKTALDLAYGAGRSQVLVDVLPKRLLIALLMRIDDIVPPHIRSKHSSAKELITQENAVSRDTKLHVKNSPRSDVSPQSQRDSETRSKRGYSFIQHLAENLESGYEGAHKGRVLASKGHKPDNTNMMSVWRKILLNDNVELLETLRDSLVWREKRPDACMVQADNAELTETADFDAAQKLSLKQMSELFADCYENGTGVYSHVQANYQQALKLSDFRSVLRSMTGLLTFSTLSTNGVIILRPMYKSLLFLALICGRFRVAEQLLRMRQFDILPSAVLITLILRRLRKEPSFPQQMCNELERYTERIEAIGVEVLTLAFMNDNTPEKMICRNALNTPLRTFGNVPLIDLCARAKCTQLLSLPCFQRLLDDRWDEVLIHLPKWIRWPVKILPFTGLLYLEYKDKQERMQYDRQFMTSMATGGSLSVIKKREALGTTNLEYSKPKNYKIGCCTCFGGLCERSKPKPFYSVDKDSFSMLKGSLHSGSSGRITVYDRVVGIKSWQKSPRWFFMLMVYRSPSTKFFYHSFIHLFFLFFFSAICLFRIVSETTMVEIIVLSYVIGYALEEIRQFIQEITRDNWMEYFRDVWNWIDMLAVGSALIAYTVKRQARRYYVHDKKKEAHDSTLSVARNFYLISLTMFYIRMLFITSISKNIGPRLKMMADMLRKDLVPLLVVIFIFVISYGVWFQGLIYPNSFYEEPDQREFEVLHLDAEMVDQQRLGLLRSFGELFKRAFYNLFDLGIILDENSCEGNVYCGNEVGFDIVLYFVMVLYTGIVNIILINLLIALFSSTVARISQQSTAHWMASRYKMVKEYSERTTLPPPFNVLCILFELSAFTYAKLRLISQRRQLRRKLRGRLQTDRTLDEMWSDSSTNENYRSTIAACGVNKRIYNEHAKRGIEKELKIVLDYILIQSFALQCRRAMLGMTWNHTNTESSDQPSQTGLQISSKLEPMYQRMKKLEEKIDKLSNEVQKLNDITRVK